MSNGDTNSIALSNSQLSSLDRSNKYYQVQCQMRLVAATCLVLVERRKIVEEISSYSQLIVIKTVRSGFLVS